MAIYSENQIDSIRCSCRVVVEVLNRLRDYILPGVSTLELDSRAEELIRQRGARPAFKGYRGFPASICASLNHQVVHGIPDSKTILKDGDILGVDIGVEMNGYFGDSAITEPVGKVDDMAARLISATRSALDSGVKKALAGNRLHDISHAIQVRAEAAGFSVVRNFVGHGIGRDLHEEPQIPNFGRPGSGPELKPGMVLALEPMVNAGSWEVKVEKDNWTAVTSDKKLSAHFEHTVLITYDGPEILTCRSR